MTAAEASNVDGANPGLKKAVLILSTAAGALLANILICQLFIFAAGTTAAKRQQASLDKTNNLCRSSQVTRNAIRAQLLSRDGSPRSQEFRFAEP